MRYHVLHIQSNIEKDWLKDLFDQHICELGVDTIDGEDYYIQSDLWEQNHEDIEAFCEYYEEIQLVGVEACPDENWNATWEAEHPVHELLLGIKIIPHCAFGAGYHETTSMMIDGLLTADLSDKIVLDHGTGTGVLAIFAKHLGAAHVVAVDIDEKSVENAKENAALNGEEIEVLHTSEFSFQPSAFSLILANIHRNILLEYMPQYASALKEGGELWLSGFYETDCLALQSAAEKEGLTITDVLANGEWRLMKCRKEVRS